MTSNPVLDGAVFAVIWKLSWRWSIILAVFLDRSSSLDVSRQTARWLMYENNQEPLPTGDLSVVFADLVAAMQREAVIDDVAISPKPC